MSALLGSLPSLDEIRAERGRRIVKHDPHDVVAWFPGVLGCEPYSKQQEMALALRDHTRVSVCGANALGKDWMAGRMALWWMKAHEPEPAKVVITGPTNRQVKDVVWQETRAAYLKARVPLGGRLFEVPYLKWDEERFIIGFSTDRDYQLQGFHSPNLLVMVTEAHGVSQKHMDALFKLRPKAVMLTGNPISESGEFYESHHSQSHLWQTINITAFDSPNVQAGEVVVPGLVTQGDIDSDRERTGEDSPYYRMTVLNEWVEGMGSLVVVPLSWARAAESAEYALGPVEVVACDVARRGQDKTVIRSRKGRVVRLLWRVQGHDTMATAGFLKAYHDAHKHAHIVVDGVGVGGGVIDRLREQGVGVHEFQGGAAASDSSRFVNRNAEVWWRMRQAYADGLAVEPDDALRSEVSSRRYTIQSDRRIALESKDAMAAEGRHSPDDGDALAMTFALDWDVDGQHLTAGSDAPEQDDLAKAEHDGTAQEMRQQISAGRGSDVSPWAPSRWGPMRRGGRR